MPNWVDGGVVEARAGAELSVLVVTSGWPSVDHPDRSIFVCRQVSKLRARGIDIDVVAYLGETNPLNYLKARREIRGRLASRHYDLIHAHFGQTFLAVFPAQLPMVFTFHGSDLFGVVGASGRYSWRAPFLRAVSHRAARAADAVIVPSDVLGNQLPSSVAYTVIGVGVDLDVFKPTPRDEARAALGLPADGRLVLFGGRPSQPVKRFDLARRVVELLGDPGAELISIEGRDPNDVPYFMSACDALLLTSKHESGPLMVKEALACNLPVVSVDVGDVRQWIGGLEGAALCGSDDPHDLAAALRSVLVRTDPFRGRDAVSSADENRSADRIIEVYRSTLGR
jgi:teichuronic acid biosynthesis glycosyltransferase TuaC